VENIDVGSEPTSATYDPANGYVYVTNALSGNVSVIDGTRVAGTVSVGSEPESATYDGTNGYVYVPNYGSSDVTVINSTGLVGTVDVGNNPVSAAYDSDAGTVYIANQNSMYVSILSGTLATGTVSLSGDSDWVVYDPDDGYVYALISGNPSHTSTVSVIDGITVVGTVSVGKLPLYATYDPGNGYVYVSNADSDNVSVISGTALVGSVDVGFGPGLAAYDSENGYVYVPNRLDDNVSVINGTTVRGSVTVSDGSSGGPYSVTYDSGNGSVYAANPGSSNVSVISGTTLAGSVNVGENSEFAAYDAANCSVYVPNSGSNNVSIISTWFPVTLRESGLPTGTEWWANVTGRPPTGSDTSSISFTEPNGNYSYSVSTTDKTYASPGGLLTVGGAAATRVVVFGLETYPSTFAETGLMAGTNWSVSLGGVTLSSDVASVQFQEPNGTHAYTIGALPGWRTPAYAGTITVRGGPVATTVPWSRVTYGVAFSETGLPSGTTWSVTLNGTENSSTSATIVASEPNGTYPFLVGHVAGYTQSLSSGNVVVSGTNVTKAVAFTAIPPATYAVTCIETGLPSGSGWWVNVTQGSSTVSTAFSNTESLSFEEPNGTYAYSVSTTNANYSSRGGSLLVHGGPVSVALAFSVIAFPVTFTEGGLPPGTSWAVTLNGTRLSGTENLAFWAVRNGSYSFSVGSVAGYIANRTSGKVRVQGGPASEPISFAPTTSSSGNGTSPTTFLGLPATEGYALLGGIIAVVVIVAASVVLFARRKKAPTDPAGPSSRPDPGGPPASP
jgi:YVTN family beta-propeller protein